MHTYSPVTAAIVEELKEICGSENVISDDPKQIEHYAHDQVPGEKYAHPPEVVVKPGHAEEVEAIVRLANEHLIPITPRGAGSGLSGGAVPIHGGICLSVERMNRILEIDPANLMAVVEPGVVTNQLDTALKPYGLFFAGYPMSEEFCFVGGNVAENAGGGRAIKYGVTRRYITGLEVVTPRGDRIQLGGKRVKDVTGYDLVALMVGSEGTLGIFTRIFIKLLPRPMHRIALLALFSDVPSAIAIVPTVITDGKLLPTAIEFMDRLSMYDTCRALKETIAYEEAGAMLLFEVDGTNEGQVHADAEVVRRLCEEHGAVEVHMAQEEDEIERFWKIRKRIPWTLKRMTTHQSVEDIVVPISAIPRTVEILEEIAQKYDVVIPCFGHAGDGNLHATPMRNPDHSVAQWEDMLPRLLSDIYLAIVELGGTISGEHGIGHKRKGYMELVMSPIQIEMMRGIKRALDPNNILNPGKIFD